MMKVDAKLRTGWLSRVGLLSFLSLFLLATAGNAVAATDKKVDKTEKVDLFEWNAKGEVVESDRLEKDDVTEAMKQLVTDRDKNKKDSQQNWVSNTLNESGTAALLEGVVAAFKKVNTDTKDDDKAFKVFQDGFADMLDKMEKDEVSIHFKKDKSKVSNYKGIQALAKILKDMKVSSLRSLLKNKDANAFLKDLLENEELVKQLGLLLEKPEVEKPTKPEPKETKPTPTKTDDTGKGATDTKTPTTPGTPGLPPGGTGEGTAKVACAPPVTAPDPLAAMIAGLKEALAKKDDGKKAAGSLDAIQAGLDNLNKLAKGDDKQENPTATPPKADPQPFQPQQTAQNDDKKKDSNDKAPEREQAQPQPATLALQGDIGQPVAAIKAPADAASGYFRDRVTPYNNSTLAMVTDTNNKLKTYEALAAKSQIQVLCSNKAMFQQCALERSKLASAMYWDKSRLQNLQSQSASLTAIADAQKEKAEKARAAKEDLLPQDMQDLVDRQNDNKTRLNKLLTTVNGSPEQTADGRPITNKQQLAQQIQAAITDQDTQIAAHKKNLSSEQKKALAAIEAADVAADKATDIAQKAKSAADNAEANASQLEELVARGDQALTAALTPQAAPGQTMGAQLNNYAGSSRRANPLGAATSAANGQIASKPSGDVRGKLGPTSSANQPSTL